MRLLSTSLLISVVDQEGDTVLLLIQTDEGGKQGTVLPVNTGVTGQFEVGKQPLLSHDNQGRRVKSASVR